MNKWKLSLTCSYCKKIFKDPIELPCEDLICKEHLNAKEILNKNQIKCQECKQEFEVKENEFKSIKFLKKQLNDQEYLSEDEIILKRKIEESIKVFYQMYDEFTSSKTQLDLDCHNNFQELRFQLDLHREKLKEKIDEIYMEMVEKTKEFDASYLKSFYEEFSSSLKSFGIKSIKEDLNGVEETFRDPHLVLKTIQEKESNLKEAIRTLQLKMNEMTQVKEDLKKSYQFKPLSLKKETFLGQLKLNVYSGVDPFKSKILIGIQPKELIKLCEFSLEDKFKLLYRASEDDFCSNVFHSKCDEKPNTLTILKASESLFIFGGFTTKSWDGNSGYKSDPNAFLFSLTNKDNQPCKMKLDSNKYYNAIICNSDFGPIFGVGDIQILSHANKTKSSFSNLGNTYKHLEYEKGTNEAKSFLAGSQYFQLCEIEVYQKE